MLIFLLIRTFTTRVPPDDEPDDEPDFLLVDEDDLELLDFFMLLELDFLELELLELELLERDVFELELELEPVFFELELEEPDFFELELLEPLLKGSLPKGSLSPLLSNKLLLPPEPCFFFQSSPNSSFNMSSHFESKLSQSPTLLFVFVESATGSSSPRPRAAMLHNITAHL